MSRVTHVQGLSCIAVLLRNPYTHIPAERVYGFAKGQPSAGEHATTDDVTPEHFRDGDASKGPNSIHADDKVDKKAKQEYWQKVQELKADKERARDNDDPAEEQRIEKEMEKLRKTLDKSIVAGRSKKFDAERENARQNVTKNIDTALEKIREYDEACADHLDKCIQTGKQMIYDPPFDVDWQTD